MAATADENVTSAASPQDVVARAAMELVVALVTGDGVIPSQRRSGHSRPSPPGSPLGPCPQGRHLFRRCLCNPDRTTSEQVPAEREASPALAPKRRCRARERQAPGSAVSSFDPPFGSSQDLVEAPVGLFQDGVEPGPPHALLRTQWASGPLHGCLLTMDVCGHPRKACARNPSFRLKGPPMTGGRRADPRLHGSERS